MLAAALALTTAAPAFAQQAPAGPEPAPAGTAEDAAELRRALAAFVTEAPFERGILQVEPDPAGLAVVVATEPLLQLLPGARDIRVAPIRYVVSEREGGDWNVFSDSPLAMSFAHATGGMEETVAYATESLRFKGVYSPSLGVFTQADTVLEGVSTSTTDAVSTSGTTIRSATASAEARPAGEGIADTEFRYREEDSAQVFSIGGGEPQPDVPALPAIEFKATVGSTAMDGSMRALRSRALVDLYLLAAREADAIQADPRATLAGPFGAELKDRLGALLPLWDGMEMTAEARDVAIRSDYGSLTAASGSQSFRMTGLSGRTSLETDMRAERIAVDSEMLPPWARELVPETVELGFLVEGGEIERALRLALDEADFAADEPWTAEDLRRIAESFDPDGVRLVLKPSRLAASALDLALGGEMRFADGAPSGELVASAAGLDEAIGTLQAAAADDPSLHETVGMLQIAKGFARPAVDGRLEWRAEFAADGSVSVNGTVMRGPTPPPVPPGAQDL